MQLSDRIGRRLKLQDLHILMAVAQAGSMAKAAGHLNTSQPNISKSIADLERALGVRLLDRHRQRVEPTGYGRALLAGGAAVFDDLRQAVKNIEFLADPAAGEVRIGSNIVLAGTFTSAVINQLSRRYPRVRFHLMTGFAEALVRGLHELRRKLAAENFVQARTLPTGFDQEIVRRCQGTNARVDRRRDILMAAQRLADD